eukprot:TRINITY_DN236_c0_g1_i1.p1 TRINITY_DN236_c0_g1~~TRINITY_DN236_c0_g1_i1.p1  ORF type:complete len:489 (-),score=186.09 TRINITY_DN236_c0_g1_i1:279-1745(-)
MPPNKGSSSSGRKDQGEEDPWAVEFKNLEKEVYGMRKEFNNKKAEFDAKQRELRSLEDAWDDLKKEAVKPNSEENPMTRGIRTLENRLDKAIIKYNEAQSIRKTYEQIVKRLKDERITFDNQLAAIEKTLKAKEHDYEELLLMAHDANHAKEAARAELARFQQAVAEERRQREKELNERRAQARARQEMMTRAENREKMRQEIVLEAQGDLSVSDEQNLKKAVVTNQMYSQLNANKKEDEQDKITTYEEAFRKIRDATGVSDVSEVISKFLTQEETQKRLMEMTKESQLRIDNLQEEKALAKHRVEEIKFSGNVASGTRRLVDDFETLLSEANSKCERNKAKYERIAKVLVNVKAGVQHLFERLEGVELTSASQVHTMNDETVVEVLNQGEEKLMKVLEVIAKVEADTGAEDAEPEVFDSPGAGEMPAYNIRVALPSQEEDGMSESDVDEEEGDDVPDREQMKKMSNLMLEKATKKTKKKGGRRRKAD